MNINYDSRAIIINDEDASKDANLLVVDRYGNVKDIMKEDNIAYPIAQIIPKRLREEDSTTITDIKEMLKAVELDWRVLQGLNEGSAIVYSDDKTEPKQLLKDGEGILRYKKDHFETAYDASMGVESSNTTFGSNHTMKSYQGFLLGLNPYMAEVYIKTDNFDINHCIIPSNGYKYPSICTEFFECIDHRNNLLHGSFVRKWKLKDSPVSFFDIDALKNIFTMTDSYGDDLNNEPTEDVKSLAEIFESDINLPLRRKIICWWYFLTKHTDKNRGVLVCFNRFLLQYLGKSFYFLPNIPYEPSDLRSLLEVIKGYIQ